MSTAVVGGPADLFLEINGLQVGPIFTATDVTGSWENWLALWNLGSATTADIRIFNADTSVFPNDYYIDDISFSAIPLPAAVWLFGSGFIGLIGLARRKTHA